MRNRLAEAMISGFAASPLGTFGDDGPWRITARAGPIVRDMIGGLPDAYRVDGAVAVHRSARIEAGAVLKGPVVVGPDCLIAAGATLRGGCWLEAENVVGPGCELKSSFLFAGTRLAHFNFVGDSMLGRAVNLEAGAVVANHRNEDAEPTIVLVYEGLRIETGVAKFGALIGDRVRIGANAVIAPGAILKPDTVVGRLALVDQREGERPQEAGSRPSGV